MTEPLLKRGAFDFKSSLILKLKCLQLDIFASIISCIKSLDVLLHLFIPFKLSRGWIDGPASWGQITGLFFSTFLPVRLNSSKKWVIFIFDTFDNDG